MSNERTPLIQTVPVAEARERYPHTLLRQFCTAALAIFPLIALAIYFIHSAVTDHDSSPKLLPFSSLDGVHAAWPESNGVSYKELKEILTDTVDPQKARQWSQFYTAGPHLAGQNLSQAEWTKERWLEWGVDTADVVAYEVYLNYPDDHRLALLNNGEVKVEVNLEEDILKEDPTSGLEDRIPVFHGYSANGNVTAPFVFVNYGSFGDFEDLVDAGIDLKGKIAIAKYGANMRGLKVKRASELGMVGVVMYSDPGDDGNITAEHGYAPYPHGPARNPSSVQRGSVEYLSVAPGDPTTIGYPSKPGVPRQSVQGKIPDIPSLPISYAEALPILQSLNGHGPNASSLPSSWHTGGLGYKGIEYNIGPSPASVTLNLYNKQHYVTTPLWNAIGVINGSVSDEVIVVGNHRDAWIAGGAGDPNSGSAALNEVVRAFGECLAAGWKPYRTIVFASWDGEEYGLIGSTEWVEEYLPWLSTSTVTYINVDVGAAGTSFASSASPLLNKAIYTVTGQVLSPNQSTPKQTVRDLWSGNINSLGSGSDYTAFQDFAGIPSIDVGFKRARVKDAVYQYHSNYDSFHWMDKFGDPGFVYHATIARVISLLALKFVEEPIIQFNASDYASHLAEYLKSVREAADNTTINAGPALDQVQQAVGLFQRTSNQFEAKVEALSAMFRMQASQPSRLTSQRKQEAYAAVRVINSKYKNLERQFLYIPGLDKRDWFKHVVFAPDIVDGYAGVTFPGLVEAVAARDEASLYRWAGIISARIYAASSSLAN